MNLKPPILLLLFILAAACQSVPDRPSDPSSVAQTNLTLVATNTLTPTPSSRATSTPTQIPFATSTPLPPTSTPSPKIEASPSPTPTVTPFAHHPTTLELLGTIQNLELPQPAVYSVENIRTFGGSITHAEWIDDKTVLVAEGHRLFMLDASDANSLRPMISELHPAITLPRPADQIHISNNQAFVVIQDTIFIFDIVDSINLALKSEHELAGPIYFQESRLFLSDDNRLDLLEIKDDELEKIAEIALPQSPTSLVFNNNRHLFVSYYGGVIIYDLQNLDEPVEISHIQDHRLGRSLVFKKNTLYVVGAERSHLYVFDISDLASPRFVVEQPFNTPLLGNLQLGTNGYMYGGSEPRCEYGACAREFYVIDITQPHGPVMLPLNREFYPSFHNISPLHGTSENRLLLVSSKSISLIDVQNSPDTAEPQILGSYGAILGRVEKIGISENSSTAVVTGGAGDGITFLEFNDLKELQVASYVSFEWADKPLFLDDMIAVTGWNNLILLDAQDPNEPIRLNDLNYEQLNGSPNGLLDWGNGQVVLSLESGLMAIDFSDPADVQEIGRLQWDYEGFQIYDIASRDELVIAAGAVGDEIGNGELRLFDLTDLTQPKQIGMITLPGEGRHIAVTDTIAYVYWQEPRCSGEACYSGIAIIDISDPARPQLKKTVEFQYLQSLEVANNRLLAGTSAGIWLFDLTLPSDPTGLGIIETNIDAYDMEIVNNVLHIAAGWDGLVRIDLPAAP